MPEFRGYKRKRDVLRVKTGRLTLFIFTALSFHSAFSCPGRFVNPLTDICWSCLFPLSIGPVKVNIGGREDTPNPSGLICWCRRPPIPVPLLSIPVGF